MGRPPCLTALLPKLYQLVIPPLDPSKSLPKKAEPWENPKIPHHAGWRPPSKFSIPVWRLPCLQVSDLPGMTYVRSAHTCPQRCPSLLTNPKPHIHVSVSKRRLLTGISSYVFHLTLSPRIKNTKCHSIWLKMDIFIMLALLNMSLLNHHLRQRKVEATSGLKEYLHPIQCFLP